MKYSLPDVPDEENIWNKQGQEKAAAHLLYPDTKKDECSRETEWTSQQKEQLGKPILSWGKSYKFFQRKEKTSYSM